MNVHIGKFRKLAYGALAASVLATVAIPALSGTAFAYGQVTTRSVQMSSSVAGNTNTSYNVTFTPATTATTVQAMAVDFCSNDPIIGDTCTAPTSFTVGTPTVTGTSITGQSGGTWTAASANSGRTLTLSNGSSTGTPSGAANFTITTVTNPNFATCGGTNTAPNCTFYARIFTFSSTANLTTWTGTANGSATATVLDAGGVALSTNSQLTITAKVQETLTFCVYTTASCTTLGAAAVNLGDTNGVLSTAGPFVDKNTKYDVATNAGGASPGVTIRFKAPLPTSGSNTIATIGTSATSSAAGTSQFGLCTWQSAGSGTLTPLAPYSSANCSTTTQTAGTGSTGGAGTAQFAFNTANAATTYGESLATTVAGASSTGTIAFIGNVSATQPAGIYTNNFTFVATGTY